MFNKHFLPIKNGVFTPHISGVIRPPNDKLKNPFTDLIEEGLNLYGLTKDQQEMFLKTNPAFILVLIGYDQLKTDRPRNLYVTNKLEKFNIQKIIITCHSDYIKTRKNYRLFFASYQNKEPKYDELQEVDLDIGEYTSSFPQTKLLEIEPVEDSYWNRILTDDLAQLFSDLSITGYKQPPTLEELQIHPLNKRLLVEISAELNTRAEAIMSVDYDQKESENFKFKQLCFLFLRYSKYSHLVEVGAANAITILNYAKISFSNMDLSGIKISGADLSYAICDYANFSYSDLRKVNFENTWLREVNFCDAFLKKVNFGQQPYLQHPSSVRQVYYSFNKSYLATISRNIIYVWNTKTCLCEYVLANHTEVITDVAISSNRKILASSSKDCSVKLWNLDSGCEIYDLKGHIGWVNNVAFSPDGKILASSSNDGSVKLWDVDSGCEIYSLKGQRGWIDNVVFSPDGEFLAFKKERYIHIWNTKNLKPHSVLQANGILFHPIKKIAVCWKAFNIEILNICDGTIQHTLTDTEIIDIVAFSLDGKILASTTINKESQNRSMRLWSVDDGHPLHVLKGHSDIINSIVFSPSGRILASSSNDCSIKLWDIDNGREIYSLKGHTGWINNVAFRTDGKILASSSEDCTVRLWKIKKIIQPEKRLSLHVSQINMEYKEIRYAVLSPDGKFLASIHNDCDIRLWKTNNGQHQYVLRGHRNWCSSLAFSSDGKILISGSEDKTLCLWRVNQGKNIQTLFGHTEQIHQVIFNPQDEKILASVSGCNIQIWKMDYSQEAYTLTGHTDKISNIAFSPNGKALASASLDKTVRIWQLDSSQVLILRGHMGSVSKVIFSPDSEIVASASSDKTVRLWKVDTGEELHTLKMYSGFVGGMSFHPSKRQLAISTRDNAIQLVELDKGRELVLKGHTKVVSIVSFNVNGKILASGSRDNTIRLWDVENGQCLSVIEGFLEGIDSLYWNQINWLIVIDKNIKCWRPVEQNNQVFWRLIWSSGISFFAKGCKLEGAKELSPKNVKLLEQQNTLKENKGISHFRV